MSFSIPSLEALDVFEENCRKHEKDLLAGKCQLCLDALLFISPISCSDSFHRNDENSANHELLISLVGHPYVLNVISRCPLIKIIFPCTVPFTGFVDLSILKSCRSLELVGIPFQRLTGLDALRQTVTNLIWNRGFEDHERGNLKMFENGDFVNDRTFKIDEVFWDQFGSWPKLKHLSFSRSSLLAVNTTAIPSSVISLNLSMNRISRFNNLASQPTNITKLCLDFNQLSRIPKLDVFTTMKLVHLSLKGNVIVSVKDLQKFQLLNYLDLSSNALTDIRELLTEIGHLNRCLQTLLIHDNPVCCHKQFEHKFKTILFNLKLFNGKKLNARNDDSLENVHIPVIATPNYGTNNVVESMSNNEFERSRRERIVMINDESSPRSDEENDYPTIRRLPEDDGNALPGKSLITTKNYLFGDVSGSYGSFNNHSDLSQGSINIHANNHHDELNNEKIKILEKRKELTENWPLKEGEEVGSSRNVSQSFSTSNAQDQKADDEEKVKEPESTEKSVVRVFDDTSEWNLEDTEEEENVFLVESYDSWNSMTNAKLLNFQDASIFTQFLFIRFRPEDLLLFEKDCTSGKILTTLDLKIVESFQALNDEHDHPIAIQILFDTSVLSKRERNYRFIEDGQCKSFMDILSKRATKNSDGQLINQPLKIQQQQQQQQHLQSQTPTSSNIQFSSTPLKDCNLWLYLCLRCGAKTQQIITDCLVCKSQLIVKDVGERLESKLSTPIAATPTNYDINDIVESTYTFEKTIVDENYFDAEHVDHNLKLMIEIAIYDLSKVEDGLSESESIKSVCECLIFNFNIKLFQPAVIIFTDNFIFLFDRKADDLKLRFFYPFVGAHQFVLSHLPDFMKNHAFWFQCLPFNQARKRNKKDKKIKTFDPTVPYLELIMFDDKLVGKAFLEHLFRFHRICYRKLDSDTSLQRNLPVIKPDLTEVIHDNISPNHNNRIGAILDEQLTAIIDSAQLSAFHEKDNPNLGPNYFLIKTFLLNLESKNLNEIRKNNQDLLKVEQNLLLLFSQENFVVCQLSGHFYTISQALASNSSLSLAQLLRKKVKFDDHIELRLLMQESLLNLLPTVYVSEEKNRIILKCRDENGTIMSFTNSFSSNQTNEHELETSGKSSLMVYDFEIDFYSVHTMKRVLELIQNVWERHFGVSLTLCNAK